jgi:hypothetical protein
MDMLLILVLGGEPPGLVYAKHTQYHGVVSPAPGYVKTSVLSELFILDLICYTLKKSCSLNGVHENILLLSH